MLTRECTYSQGGQIPSALDHLERLAADYITDLRTLRNPHYTLENP